MEERKMKTVIKMKIKLKTLLFHFNRISVLVLLDASGCFWDACSLFQYMHAVGNWKLCFSVVVLNVEHFGSEEKKHLVDTDLMEILYPWSSWSSLTLLAFQLLELLSFRLNSFQCFSFQKISCFTKALKSSLKLPVSIHAPSSDYVLSIS